MASKRVRMVMTPGLIRTVDGPLVIAAKQAIMAVYKDHAPHAQIMDDLLNLRDMIILHIEAAAEETEE